MLYLVTCDLKGGYPMPAEQWLGLVIKTMDEVQEYKKQGKMLFHGAFVGRQAGCMVCNVQSNEELQKLLCQLPVWPFMEWNITPMISTEEAINSIKQAMASVQAAKK